MRDFKFRAWHCEAQEYCEGSTSNMFSWIDAGQPVALEQYFDLQDINGVNYCVGDLVNVFFTSDNGEHIHDCIYRVVKGELGGIELRYESLLWESVGWNQYTLHSTFSEKYSGLSEDYLNRGRLMLEDSYGENHMTRDRWKEVDESRYFEIIGNIRENKELLCKN
jgi:hypothetical protein